MERGIARDTNAKVVRYSSKEQESFHPVVFVVPRVSCKKKQNVSTFLEFTMSAELSDAIELTSGSPFSPSKLREAMSLCAAAAMPRRVLDRSTSPYFSLYDRKYQSVQ